MNAKSRSRYIRATASIRLAHDIFLGNTSDGLHLDQGERQLAGVFHPVRGVQRRAKGVFHGHQLDGALAGDLCSGRPRGAITLVFRASCRGVRHSVTSEAARGAQGVSQCTAGGDAVPRRWQIPLAERVLQPRPTKLMIFGPVQGAARTRQGLAGVGLLPFVIDAVIVSDARGAHDIASRAA